MNLFHIIDNYLPLIRTILRNWEHYEKDAKWVVMDYVIDDFFIFSAIGKYWDKDSINEVVEKIATKTMFPIYERYFSKDDGTTVKKLFTEFEALFTSIKDENFINEKISLLKDVFNERYRNEIILEGEHEKITSEQENWLSQKFTDFIKETVNETLSPFSFKSKDEQTALTFDVQKSPIFTLILTGFFFKDSEYVDEFIKTQLLSITIDTFIKSIVSHIEVKEVSYKDKEKQSTLIKMVKSLSISPTTVIGNRDEFWDEESADLLKKYTSQMVKIKFADGYNCYYIFDNSLIEFSLDNIKIEYNNLTLDEIEDDCRKNEDGSILYNVTNEIYLPFTQNELEQHIANTKRKLTIYADIKVRLHKDKVGAGIIIVPK